MDARIHLFGLLACTFACSSEAFEAAGGDAGTAGTAGASTGGASGGSGGSTGGSAGSSAGSTGSAGSTTTGGVGGTSGSAGAAGTGGAGGAAGAASLPAGLVYGWSFDEQTGGAVPNLAPGGPPMLLFGSTLGPGARGSGLKLDGSGYGLVEHSLQDALRPGTADFTVTVYVKSTADIADIFSYPSNLTEHAPIFFLAKNGPAQPGPVLTVQDTPTIPGAGCIGHIATGAATDGSYHHLAFVWRTPGGVEIYLDGVAQGLTDEPGCATPSVGDSARTDDWYVGRSYAGVVDELLVFGRALGAAEIAGML